MDALTIVIIALSLALDAFAVSVANGLASGRITRRDMLITGSMFGGFQFIMPVIGWFLGQTVADHIRHLDHWISFALLLTVGLNMIVGAYKDARSPHAPKPQPPSFKKLLIQAFATSIDALAVGVGLAFVQAEIITTALVIGLITFALSLLGSRLGQTLGARLLSVSGYLGGGVLIAIGVKILLEHLLGGG